jgi:hypothetical protein
LTMARTTIWYRSAYLSWNKMSVSPASVELAWGSLMLSCIQAPEQHEGKLVPDDVILVDLHTVWLTFSSDFLQQSRFPATIATRIEAHTP